MGSLPPAWWRCLSPALRPALDACLGPSCKATSQGLRVALTGVTATSGVAAVPAPPASASPLAGVCTILQGAGVPDWWPVHGPWGLGWEEDQPPVVRLQGTLGTCASHSCGLGLRGFHMLHSGPHLAGLAGAGPVSTRTQLATAESPWPSVLFRAQSGSLMASKATDKAREPSVFLG